MRILIVDDDEIALEMLRHSLEKAGHEVESSVNGRDALAKLASGSYRIVISDWEMPEMNGVELCRQIRASDWSGYIYTILLTGRDAATSVVDGLGAGADDLITKPFNPAELAV